MGKAKKMAKRRTRKDKERAQHTFHYNWSPEAKKSQFTHNVKGQLKNEAKVTSRETSSSESADLLAQDTGLASIKHNIIRSLFLAGLILGIELVIYLAWF